VFKVVSHGVDAATPLGGERRSLYVIEW